jgi:ABC-2 type transport system permease protein
MSSIFSPPVTEDHDPDSVLVRVHAPESFHRGFSNAVRDLVAHRELLSNLIRKELKVKYKDSSLGFLWSLARPMFLLLIYYMVFGVFLHAGIPDFAIYLFSGLLAFDLLNAVLAGATTSIVANAGLIKKVYFPREILVLSVVGAAIVHWMLQLVVMIGALALLQHNSFGLNLLYLPLAFVTLLVFVTALGLLLAAANVFLRDVQHLLELVLLFWFWTTPTVYLARQATDTLGGTFAKLYLMNPMVNIVMGFQRAMYKGGTVSYKNENLSVLSNNGSLGLRLAAVLAFSCALLWFAQRVFARVQGNFAQEL